VDEEVEVEESSRLPVKRDELGFITSSQPNLSALQVQFILAVGTTGSSMAAAESLGLTMDDVMPWFEDKGFLKTYNQLLANNREGVKQIGAQILPWMMLELTKILASGTNKEKLLATKLLSQMQGLLITQNSNVDKGAIEALRDELMRPRPAQQYRTLDAPKD
jgi:hypothetical protein